ncbi:MAG: hypothetical protein QGG54_08055, partial [Gammaproteobacteria bacterium]|nr:hypothetical protein [Gammaproteobacteria bacterium]
MKRTSALLASLVLSLSTTNAVADTSALFIGNSFTYGHGSAARFYRADTVTDLNNQGIGGVPALFKSFTDQAGLDYEDPVSVPPKPFGLHVANDGDVHPLAHFRRRLLYLVDSDLP